jgi:hypothetical protein
MLNVHRAIVLSTGNTSSTASFSPPIMSVASPSLIPLIRICVTGASTSCRPYFSFRRACSSRVPNGSDEDVSTITVPVQH